LDKMIADYMTDIKATEGRGAAQLAAEEAQGVQAKKTALTNVQNQINTKLAEFNQIQAQLQALSTEVAGKPITMASIIGAQSQIQNKLIAQKNSFAADIGLLQAQALALQGQLTDAQNAANRSVDLRYSDIETRLNNQATLINLLQGQLTKEEQTRADAVKLYLADQQTAIDDQKQVEKDIQSVMLTAAQNGAPSDLLSQISTSASVVEATQRAGTYLQEPKEQWSEPYSLGGDLVQKNLKTGEIRTAVNVAAGGGVDLTTDQKNYQFYSSQEIAAGRTPKSFGEWSGIIPSGDETYYDENLLIYISGGASASQAAQLVIADQGENLTEKEKATIFSRAQEIERNYQTMKPTEVTTPPAEAKKVILSEAEKTAYQRAGYTPSDISNIEAGHAPGIFGSIAGWTDSFVNRLFGE